MVDKSVTFLIVILLISLLGIYSDSDGKEVTERNVQVIPLNNTIRSGNTSKLLLYLPGAYQNTNKWQLVVGSSLKVFNGNLESQPSVQYITVSLPKTGIYNVVLFLIDSNDSPIAITKAEIIVKRSWVKEYLSNWAPPIIVAILAILGYILKRVISKYYLKNKFLLLLETLSQDLYVKIESEESIKVPSWIDTPAESEWADIISIKPIQTYVTGLRRLILDLQNDYINKDDAKLRLENLYNQFKNYARHNNKLNTTSDISQN